MLEITASQDLEGIEAGSTPSLICKLNVPGQIWWTSNGKNLTTIKDFDSGGRLDIKQASRNDTGDYKCMAQTADGELLKKDVHIRVIGKYQLLISYNLFINIKYNLQNLCLYTIVHIRNHKLFSF